MCLLFSAANKWLHTMMYTRLSPKASPLPISTITPQPGVNGTASADGSRSHPISTASRTPCLYSKSSLTRYVRESLRSRRNPFRNEAWSNTSTLWAKYYRPWEPQTPDSIKWGPLTSAWAENLWPTREKTLLPQESTHCLSLSSTP